MNSNQIPNFDFVPPKGYSWLIDRNLVGFEANSALQPWHYLPSRHAFDLSERWPTGLGSMRLFAFAKRQDCDDLACFEVHEHRVERVVVVHGWTAEGYQIDRTYSTFWDWLKAVVDDLEEWVDVGDAADAQ
jgi:hypothetical protein